MPNDKADPTGSTEFAALLDLLGIEPGERVSICSQKPGGRFEAIVPINRADAEAVARSTPYVEHRDVWFSVNPVELPEGYRGRGTDEHVTRCVALFADVDIKLGGVTNANVAEAVAGEISVALGQSPCAVVFTGHGGHVYWTLDAEDDAWTLDTAAKRADAAAVYDRFHRLCTDIAGAHGGSVDKVSQLSRVLRVPGTYNRKNPDDPIPVELHAWPYGGGGPLSYREVTEALDAYGVPEQPEDRQQLGESLSDPHGWAFGEQTSSYVAAMVDGWRTDAPRDGLNRHSWLVGQSVRLACAHRLGRISDDDHDKAAQVLTERFGELLASHGDPRRPTPGEVAGALSWGVRRAAAFTDEQAAEEIGGAESVSSTTIPGQARFTDAGLAEAVAAEVLSGEFLLARGIGWLSWTGTYWRECGDGPPTDAVRRHVLDRIRYYADRIAEAPDDDLIDNPGAALTAGIDAWKKVGSAARIAAVLKLAGNIVEVDAAALDADADLLNTPGGIVDLRTGAVSAHDPDRLMTKITGGSYVPGYRHPDFEKARSALPESECAWLQRRIGQAITGYRTPDDVIPLLHGTGGNGKTSLVGDGLLSALGGYGCTASAKLFAAAAKGSEHSTEMADLKGRRFVLGEELTEGQALDVTTLKRITVSTIKARFCRQDNIEFSATHSLFLTSNYQPRIAETDHGTWRRMARLVFRQTFQDTEAKCVGDADRLADAGLRERIKFGRGGQHDAAVTWAVEGAMAWYANPATALLRTPQVEADTKEWRSEADRILAFWTEHLVADPGHSILASDLLSSFNQWMTEGGHHTWAKETFGPKFAAHSETLSHGVEKAKPRNAGTLSRPRFSYGEAAGRPWVWTGVRYRNDADDAADELRSKPANSAGAAAL